VPERVGAHFLDACIVGSESAAAVMAQDQNMVAVQAAVPVQPIHNFQDVDRLARAGQQAYTPCEASPVGAGLLGGNEPEPCFLCGNKGKHFDYLVFFGSIFFAGCHLFSFLLVLFCSLYVLTVIALPDLKEGVNKKVGIYSYLF
jgi:hypothetical protein